MELRDVMTPNPTMCRPEATARDAAALMRDQDIGDVLVQDERWSAGHRHRPRHRDPRGGRRAAIRRMSASVRSATSNVKTVDVDTPVDEVIRLMSDAAVRRIPVCEGGRAGGHRRPRRPCPRPRSVVVAR